jgi:anti-anti-sigma factor
MAPAWSWRSSAGSSTLVLAGDLDVASSAGLAAEVNRVLSASDRPSGIVVETSDVTFLDSSGLRVLLSLASDHPGKVRFGPFSPVVSRLVELTGTVGLLPPAEGSDEPSPS